MITRSNGLGRWLLVLWVVVLCSASFAAVAADEGDTTAGDAVVPSLAPSRAVDGNPGIMRIDNAGGQANWGQQLAAMPEEARRALLKASDAKLAWAEASALVMPDGYFSTVLYLEKEWKEPNDYAHRNYCGPGATQVALDARLPASSVPDIDTIGKEEGIDPNWGVTATAIKNVLNTRLGTSWYSVGNANSAIMLSNMLMTDLLYNYAMVTGCNTKYMPGWTVTANHIVAAYGYTEDSSGSTKNVTYAETAGSVAGYYGSFRVTAALSSFWGYVSQNPVQVW